MEVTMLKPSAKFLLKSVVGVWSIVMCRVIELILGILGLSGSMVSSMIVTIRLS